MGRGVFDGPFFHFSDPGRHGHDHPGCNQLAMMHFLNEMTEHSFRDFKICNHSIFHGADSSDGTGSTTEHVFSFFADS